jgi:uncharacterized Tic20 family protein
MPSSETDGEVPGQTLATVAETLYLVNLLLVPGVAFVLLLWLYQRHAGTAPPLARCHLRNTVSASLWAGVLLIVANAVIILLGGYDAPYTWMVVVLYFTTAHSTLVLFGVLGVAKAAAGQPYRYPLVGRPC